MPFKVITWRKKQCMLLLSIILLSILGIHLSFKLYLNQVKPVKVQTNPACPEIHKLHRIFNPSTTFTKLKTNFPIITPHIEPHPSKNQICKNFYAVVVVNSYSHGHRLLRDAIRKTWGNTSSLITDDNCLIKWRLVFSLGITNDANTDKSNIQEAKQRNDIIIGQFKDNYKNIPLKTFMAHWWAFNTFNCRYVLKTDDDVYVRIPKLLNWLVNEGSPSWFYGGLQHSTLYIDRDPHSKWYITREQFNESSWPPFAHGAFHILSTDVLPTYFYYTQLRQPFHTDDAYIGVAARDLGIPLTRMRGFTLTKPKTDCQFLRLTAIGHALTPDNMVEFHKTYESIALRKDMKC